jgi:hypothetical protein
VTGAVRLVRPERRLRVGGGDVDSGRLVSGRGDSEDISADGCA